MAGGAIEEALELWASSLREVKRRIRPLFTQERVAVSAGLFLDGLLGPERGKTGWMRAEAAGDPGPWRQQAILGGRRAARPGARLRAGGAGRRGGGAGDRRDRLPQAGPVVVRRGAAVHGLGGQGHRLPG